MLLALAALGVAVPSSPAAAFGEGCANEEFRRGAAAAVPDCRAYEMVTPPMSSPYVLALEKSGTEASLDGERFAWYIVSSTYPGSPTSGPYYLSSRGPGGWLSKDMVPPQSAASGICGTGGAFIAAYSADLSASVLGDGWNWTGYPKQPDDGGTVNCGHDEPLLVAGEPQGAQNLFLHDSEAPTEAGFYELINPTPGGFAARDAWLIAASGDFSHLVFGSPLSLTPEAPVAPKARGKDFVSENVYENVGGALHLVTILPGGVATWGVLANFWSSNGYASANFTNALSADGERAFFYAGGELSAHERQTYVGGNLYLREHAGQGRSEECAAPQRACTTQLDAPNLGAPGPGGGGRFQWASADGSKAFFTDCSRLTEDSTAVSGGGCGGFASEPEYQPPTGNDLYEYDLAKPAGQRLRDLSVDHEGADALGADVQGLAGVSPDGSYVYFVADGVLSGGEENQRHERAQAGQPNLYVRHGAKTSYIATLGAPAYKNSLGEQCDWASYTALEDAQPAPPFLCARLSRDGSFLAFTSQRSLTGYDNVVEGSGERDREIFLYDAADGTLSCASCDPEGRPPTANGQFEDPRINPPMVARVYNHGQPAYLTRYVTDSGRVFFDTTNALLPADANDTYDVYEWEPVGVGSCTQGSSAFKALDGGCLYLISSGASANRSLFQDASASGNDVFFTTGQALVGYDTDNAIGIYDARVGGGFAEPPPPPPACDENTFPCRRPGALRPSGLSAPSATFSGPGNPILPPPPPKPTCKKGYKKVKLHGKTVCRRIRKHHRHHRHAHHARRGAQA